MDALRWLLRKQQIPGWVFIIWVVAIIVREIVGLASDVDFLTSKTWAWDTPTDILFHPGFLLMLLGAGIIWLLFIGPRLYLRGNYIRGEKVYLADLVRDIPQTEPPASNLSS